MAASIARADDDESLADQVEQGVTELDHGRADDLVFLARTAAQLRIAGFEMQREGDKLIITGRARYELDREAFWDAVKELDGWESDVVVDIDVEHTDVRGFHTVEPGDTLASIADRHLGSAARELEILDANRDRMNGPEQILPGQQLLIPWSRGR